MAKTSYLIAAAAMAAAALPVSGARAETDPNDPFTGFYIGLNAGLSRGSASIGGRTVTRPSETVPGEEETDPPIVIPASSETIPSDSASTGIGLIGGGQVGFNYATRTMLIGIEADVEYTGSSAVSDLAITETLDEGSTLPARLLTSTVTTDIDYTGSVRIRGGLRQQDLVYYATAGIAAARLSVTSTGSTSVTDGEDGTRTVTVDGGSATHMGWTGGVGILGWFGAHAIGGIELRYSNYGSKTYDLAGTVDTPSVPTDISLSDLQFLVRMSFRF